MLERLLSSFESLESDKTLLTDDYVYDAWTPDHTLVPMLLCLHGFEWKTALLFVYLWESWEAMPWIQWASLDDSLIVDPIEGFLGILVACLILTKMGPEPIRWKLSFGPAWAVHYSFFLIYCSVGVWIRDVICPTHPYGLVLSSYAHCVLLAWYLRKAENRWFAWIVCAIITVWVTLIHFAVKWNSFYFTSVYFGTLVVVLSIYHYVPLLIEQTKHSDKGGKSFLKRLLGGPATEARRVFIRP